MLNRDIENNEVDIYDVESHQGLSVELDTNMLTEKGRQKIAEDLLKSNMIVNTVKLIATTDRVGVEDFFSETDKTHKTYEAVKTKIATDPELAAQLNNDNLTPSQKEEMLDEITGAVMVKLGYSENSNVLISTDATGQDSKEIKGFISTETDNSYINDKNINSTEDLVTTAGHEASSYIDIQEGMDITQNRDDNNLYSDNFGENLASYTNFALDVTGQGSMATGNTHNSGQVTSTPSVFNDNTFAVNNAEFAGLDKEKGDNRQLAKQEIQHIQNVSEDYAQEKGISQEEAYNKLYDSAMYAVDAQSREDNAPISQEQQDKGFISATNETQQDINSDIAYLRDTSRGEQITNQDDFSTQDMFSATQEQFNDPDYNPDELVGLQSALANLLVFTPVGRVANTAVKGVARVADDVVLTTGIKVDNAIKNTVTTDNYYSVANKVIDPDNISKATIGVDVIYGAVSDEPPVTSSQLIGNRINAWVIQPVKEEVDNKNE